MSANIRTFLDLSTAHLSLPTRKWLDAQCATIDPLNREKHSECLSLMGATDAGWFLWVDPEPETEYPSDLAACMRYALNEDCAYILFDADAPECDDLPSYEDGGDAA
jgi:hypothetical protein